MSRGRRELLALACAVCGQPVKGGEGTIHLTLREMHTVHFGECQERFEEAVAAAVLALAKAVAAAPPQGRQGE